MVRSMTAFGRAKEQIDGKNITVEIKSVNNRFLDCSVKITRAYSYLEDKVKEYINKGGISRGKVEIFIQVELTESKGSVISLDEEYLKSYLASLEKLRDEYGLANDISVMSVAANANIFTVTKAEEDAEKDFADIAPVLDAALSAFLERRAVEGERLRDDLMEKKANLIEIKEKIAEKSAEWIATYRSRLEQRLRDILSDNTITMDESRILTECAIFADKVAIDEELVRLDSHFKAFDEIFASDEPVGRKLDFLLQEMNRETNTIGSKSQNTDIAKLVIQMKTELEKIREQIQNLE